MIAIQHNHSRSQSDPTKNCHLKTPESDFAKLSSSSSCSTTASHHDSLFHAGIKRKRLDFDEIMENEQYYDFKRSRTAPPSPPYEIDEDLKLRSPLRNSRSLSPAKIPQKFVNSMKEYPDTCYSQYNQEWKQRLEILVKADDPVVYSRFKDYCNDIETHHDNVDFNSNISSKIPNKKLADLVSAKYQQNNMMKISSIINFPFENNYTYQNSGYLQDIEYLRKIDHQSINLSKYNHIFNQFNSNHEPTIEIKKQRKSHGMITDLPLNFEKPQLHTFVHSTRTSPTTTRILPPQTPKTQLPSPITSPKSGHHHHHHVRTCISCKSIHSPCWRPSWSITQGQLCNSCGLRYKKTGAHCLNDNCLRIPAKGEWTLMKNRGKLEFYDEKTRQLKYCYKCLHCNGEVEVNE